MSKPNNNRAMPSDEPRNLGHYDHTDLPAYKTPDAVEYGGTAVDDSLVIQYQEALSKGVTLSS